MPRGTIKTKETVKIGPAIDAKLYQEFLAVAQEIAQSQRYLLEKAIAPHLHYVVPSQHLVGQSCWKHIGSPMRISGSFIKSWPSSKCQSAAT